MPKVKSTFMVTPILTKQEKKLRKQEDAELKRQAGLMRSQQAAQRKASAAAHKGQRKKYNVLSNQPAPPAQPAQPVSTTAMPTPPPPPPSSLATSPMATVGAPTTPMPVAGGPTSISKPSVTPPPAYPLIEQGGSGPGNARGYRTKGSYRYPSGKGLSVPRPWLVIVLGGGLIIANLFTQDNFAPVAAAVTKKPHAQKMRQPLTPKGTWLSVVGELIFLVILATIARTSATASKFVIGFLVSIWLVWLVFAFPNIAKNKGLAGTVGQIFPSVDSSSKSSSKTSTQGNIEPVGTKTNIGGGVLHYRQIMG